MDYEKKFEDGLSKLLLAFYSQLEDLAYARHEMTASDLIDFSERYREKVLFRAEGIIDSFLLAYQTLIDGYEDLTLSKYRAPTVFQRRKIDESISKLGKRFENLLSIIRAKATVAIDDIEDDSMVFDKIQILRDIQKTTFKDIMDSLKSGKYLFGLK